MKAIFITHCSRDKNPDLELSSRTAIPEQVYTSASLQKFIKFCKENTLDWAIFSDKFGVVFPDEQISWYNKPPDSVTEAEFYVLVESFTGRLSNYDEIHFYHRPSESHLLFERIEKQARKRGMNIIRLDEKDLD